MAEINGITLPFVPIGGTNTLKQSTNYSLDTTSSDSKFAAMLDAELIKFSGHAQNRMTSRDIKLNDVDVMRLDEACEKAKDKGAKESLVMLDDKMFVVAVDNKTVITMFDKTQMQNDIITNIDSFVFA
jgi:flagellar operon protein